MSRRCPYCPATVVNLKVNSDKTRTEFYVRCTQCGMSGPIMTTEMDAHHAWDAIVEVVEKHEELTKLAYVAGSTETERSLRMRIEDNCREALKQKNELAKRLEDSDRAFVQLRTDHTKLEQELKVAQNALLNADSDLNQRQNELRMLEEEYRKLSMKYQDEERDLRVDAIKAANVETKNFTITLTVSR